MLVGNAALVGAAHIKMAVMQEGSAAFDCIAFNHGEYLPQLKPACRLTFVTTLKKTVWARKAHYTIEYKRNKV